MQDGQLLAHTIQLISRILAPRTISTRLETGFLTPNLFPGNVELKPGVKYSFSHRMRLLRNYLTNAFKTNFAQRTWIGSDSTFRGVIARAPWHDWSVTALCVLTLLCTSTSTSSLYLKGATKRSCQTCLCASSFYWLVGAARSQPRSTEPKSWR